LSDPNSTQVGGDHYRGSDYQHWDHIEAFGHGYLEGCATKYIMRWRQKGGVQDLQKACHYIDKMISLYERSGRVSRGHSPDHAVAYLCQSYSTPDAEKIVILLILQWGSRVEMLAKALRLTSEIAAQEIEA
jgi:hypothetical protein